MDAELAHAPPGTDPFTVRARTRAERLRAPLLTGGVVAGLTLALHLRDPHAAGSWGLCPSLAITGFYCPGCGGLRAVNDLGNGDLLGAASSNLLFVALVPFLILGWVVWTRRAWRGTPSGAAARGGAAHPYAGLVIGVSTVVLVVFGVLRNLPVGAWLAP